jgi:hypothetical protein
VVSGDCWVNDEIIAWEISDGGAIYWLLADNAISALELWTACIKDQGMENEDFDSIGIKALDVKKLSSLRFHGYESGAPHGDYTCTMLEEMERDTSPRVVACSEWD